MINALFADREPPAAPALCSRLAAEPPWSIAWFSSDGGSVSQRLLKEELGSVVHGSMRDC